MRYLFVDESYDSRAEGGDKRYFVLAALKTNSIECLESVIKDSRKRLREYNYNCKGKKKIKLAEFHEHELHNKYPVVKKWLLERIFKLGQEVEIYVVWLDMDEVIFPDEVERYRTLAKELLTLCGVEGEEHIHVDVFMDAFRPSKERSIKNYLISELGNPHLKITFEDSQKFSPLQAVDMIAGTYRRNLHNNDPFGYKKIRRFIAGEFQYKNK